MPGSLTACCPNTGVTIAVDRIAAKLRSLKLVIAESLHVVDPVHTVCGPLIEGLESVLWYSRAREIVTPALPLGETEGLNEAEIVAALVTVIEAEERTDD
jgi:hypothetical protein